MREHKLILSAIEHFKVNLDGLTVLTEAASGNYIWSPIIAALSGAKVLAFTKSSCYGSFQKIKSATISLAKKFNLSKHIKVISKLNADLIHKADIITNSGFLRPLDENKLKYCKKTAVIPLMWETWEFRSNDLDLSYCNRKGIPVLGTNESHPYLKTISYLGLVVKKILFENNIEVLNSNICIAGRGKFARSIMQSLKSDGAYCFNISTFSKKDKLRLADCDALILADHESDILYIGKNGRITAKEIKILNKDLIIIHVSGNVDSIDLKQNGVSFYPEKIAPPYYMSVTADYVGPKPFIDLFTAGLKVGELLAKYRVKGMSYDKSISQALKNKLCQDFSIEQKKLYYI